MRRLSLLDRNRSADVSPSIAATIHRPRIRSVTCLTLLVGIVLSGHAPAGEPDGRAMTVDDVLQLARVRSVLLSPDGQQVFYGVSKLDWEKNRRQTRYYMIPFRGGEAREYIGKAGGRSFQFSPDGRFLSFTRKVDGDDQVFAMSTDGGEALALTTHAGGIEDYRWAPSSRSIYFSAEEPRTDEEQKQHDLGLDAVFIDEAPNGKHEARFQNLWRFDLPAKKEVRLTNEKFVLDSFDGSPDGSLVILTARPDTRTNYPFLSELYLLDVANESLTKLTDNLAPEDDPRFSPDGQSILYRAPSETNYELRNGYFWIMDLASKRARRLEGQCQGEVNGIAWSADGRHILFNENRGADTNLYRLDAQTGDVTALTARSGTMRARAYSANREQVVFSYENVETPLDLWAAAPDGEDAVRLTDLNPAIGDTIRLSKGEFLKWKGKGGMTIEGLYMDSLGHEAGTKQPMIAHIHGGPAGVITNRFNAEFQMLAGLGYAILAPNVRGSSGYGDELLRGLKGEVGDGEFVDLMAGVDHAIAQRDIDAERLGVRGWSWGGVASSYTITQTNRFKAASVGAMVGNWSAETGPGFNFDVSLWYIGGTPWDDAAEWAKRSSITHVRNVTTPTILFHGARDETSSVNQSLMFFTALRDIGKAPVRYIKFPRQRHGVDEPRLHRVHLVEEARWFKKYIEDAEWQEWEMPK